MAGSLRIAAAATLFVAAACSDNPSLLSSPAAPAGRALASRAGSASLFSNHARYRDQGTHPAEGRSGSASLTMRALYQPSGTVRVLASTADVDDPAVAAPGTISRVQVKVFDADGRLVSTASYRNTAGGTLALVLRGVPVGFRVQLQANVRDIDGSRTDVVTVSDRVVRAPELVVTLPPTGAAVAGMPVNIVATVVNNSPTGSRADCVLYVDGVEVDRAAGIWVDGLDAVSCAFTTTFASTGTQVVSVALVNVPGSDPDAAPPTAQMTVQVADPAVVSYDVSVDDHYTSTMSRYDYQWRKPDGSYRDYASTDSTVEHLQSISLVGTVTRATSFPVARLSFGWSSNGTTYEDDSFQALDATTDAQGRSCANQLITEQGAQLYVCSTGTGSTGVTAFGFTRFAGRVAYHSSGFANAWDGVNSPSNYSWNDNYEVNAQGGQPRLLGADVSFHLSVTDLQGTYTATPAVTLSPYSEAISGTPYTCAVTTPDWLEGGSINTCTAAGVNAWGVRGSAHGG